MAARKDILRTLEQLDRSLTSLVENKERIEVKVPAASGDNRGTVAPKVGMRVELFHGGGKYDGEIGTIKQIIKSNLRRTEAPSAVVALDNGGQAVASISRRWAAGMPTMYVVDKELDESARRRKEAIVRTPGPMSDPEEGQPELEFFQDTGEETDPFLMFDDMLSMDGIINPGLIEAVTKGFMEANENSKYENEDIKSFVVKNVKQFLKTLTDDMYDEYSDDDATDNMLVTANSDDQIASSVAAYLESIAEILK